MADRPPYPGDDTDAAPHREPTSSTPGWVKVSGIIALVVILLFVILMFTGGPGGHGPGDHTRDVNQEQDIDTGDGGGQDPSMWDR